MGLSQVYKLIFKVERLSEGIMIAFAATSLTNVHDFLSGAGHNNESAWALAVALGASLVAVSIMLCHTDFDNERTAFYWLMGAGLGLGGLSGALQYSSYSNHLEGWWPVVLGFGPPLLGEVALAFAVNAYLKAQARSRFRAIGETVEDAVSTFLTTAVDEMDGEFIKKYLEKTVNTMAKVAVDSVSTKAMHFYQRPGGADHGQLEMPLMMPAIPLNGRPVTLLSGTNGNGAGHHVAPVDAHHEGQDDDKEALQQRLQQGRWEKTMQRRRELLALINNFNEEGQDIQIAELARRLKVKRDTIYRDLDALEADGIIRRDEGDDSGIEVLGAL